MLEAEMDDADMPSPRLPELVRWALRDTYDGSECWSAVSQALCTVERRVWTAWAKFVRKRGYQRRFRVPATDVILVVETGDVGAQLTSDEGLTLIIPSSQKG